MTRERAAALGIVLLLVALGSATFYLLTASEPLPAAVTRPFNPLIQLFRAAEAPLALVPEPPRADDAAETPPPVGHVRLCGLGTVRAGGDSSGLDHVDPAARAATQARLRQHFAAHASERVRAAGLVLELALGRADAADAARVRQPACADTDRACEAQLLALAGSAADAVGAEPVRRLGRMAMATADPFVYAAALQACTQARGSDAAGHCSMLNLRRWAQLDSGNAAPWMALGSEAAAAGDTGTLNDAMYRVAHAGTVDVYWGTLPHELMQALPRGEPLLTRTLLTVDAWSAQAVLALPVYQVLARHCAPPLLADSNRWQVCDGIARVLTERGRSTFDLDAGASLGQQLGWPPQRVEAIRSERESLAAMAPRLVDAGGIICASVQRFSQAAELMSLYGELGAYRVMALLSGQPGDGLAAVLRPNAGAQLPLMPPAN